jgi:hypothetical protein
VQNACDTATNKGQDDGQIRKDVATAFKAMEKAKTTAEKQFDVHRDEQKLFELKIELQKKIKANFEALLKNVNDAQTKEYAINLINDEKVKTMLQELEEMKSALTFKQSIQVEPKQENSPNTKATTAQKFIKEKKNTSSQALAAAKSAEGTATHANDVITSLDFSCMWHTM